MGTKPRCSKVGLNRGAWTATEDRALVSYIKTHGDGKWRSLPKKAGLQRCGKSCRLRWLNYLRPGIKRGNISEDEEDLIIRLHKLLGNRWSLIAGRLPGRTDNEIKNYWNTNLGRRVNIGQSKDKCPAPPVIVDEEQAKVVRTKAVRCSRPLFGFADEMITTAANLNSMQLKQSESSKSKALGNNCVDSSAEQITSETMQEENSDGSNMLISSADHMLAFEGWQQLDLQLDFEWMVSFLDSEEWFQI